MIQKEVAERINADPDCKEYGALSVLVQYYCNTSIVRTVAPTSFIPRPKVESIVIKLDKLDKPRVETKDVKFMFELVRAGFNMRRKTLWNASKTLKVSKENLEVAFEKSGIDPKRRAETLTLQEFSTLSDCIYDVKITE